MKRKIFILSAIAALCTLVAGCTDEVKSNQLDSLQLSNTYVSIAPAGGSNTVTVTATGPWQFVDDHSINTIPDWLTVEPTSGNAGTTTVTFTGTGSEAYRLAKLKIKIGDQEQYINVAQGTDAASAVKIAEALTGPDGRKLELTGAVTGWYSNAEKYGNFYITDDTGTILIYGLADTEGKVQNNPLESWGIEMGDVVTIVGPRGNYKGDPQMVDVTLVKLVKSLIQIVGTVEGNIPKEGGEKEIRMVCKGGGPTVTIPEADQAWLSVSDIRMIPGVPDPQFPTVAVPDTAVVTMKAVANAAGARTSTVAFGSTSGENSSSVSVEIVQEGAIAEITVADFNAAEVSQAQYRITGVVMELYASDKQGESFYIQDWSGKTLAYRATGFKASGAKVGDIVTVVGQRGEFKGNAQLVSGTFEEIKYAVTEISVTDFLSKPDSKNVYYKVTGTITSLMGSNGKPNDYGNLYISDGTSTLYVFGTYPGYGATGDNRKHFIANTGIEVGDELTMIGYKDTYTDKNGVSTIELCGGIYFSHKKKN
jgi:RPA family protein